MTDSTAAGPLDFDFENARAAPPLSRIEPRISNACQAFAASAVTPLFYSRAKATFGTLPQTPEDTAKMPLAVVTDNRRVS
jgi:hypothetical protein